MTETIYLPASEYEAKYLEGDGACCPYCQSGQIQGDHIEITGGVAWQLVECLDCGARWDDVYNLVGIDNLTVPEPEEKDAQTKHE